MCWVGRVAASTVQNAPPLMHKKQHTTPLRARKSYFGVFCLPSVLADSRMRPLHGKFALQVVCPRARAGIGLAGVCFTGVAVRLALLALVCVPELGISAHHTPLRALARGCGDRACIQGTQELVAVR